MKPIKSVYINGTTTEILLVKGKYFVRKRLGSRVVAMQPCSTLDLAVRYFDFVRG